MEATCQRCHETLRAADLYCPACGLPQLFYVAAEAPLISLGDGLTLNKTGAASELTGLAADGIAWRPALRAALMLAVPAGLLCSRLTPIGQSLLGLIWMLGAASWAVSLYVRGARPGWLSMGSGARIGLVTGLLASWLAVSVDGVGIWVARFLFHQGGQIDSSYLAKVDENLKFSQQLWAEMGMATAQIAQASQFTSSWMLSPEGRAGSELSESLATAALLILFGILGGAAGARFLAQPRRPKA